MTVLAGADAWEQLQLRQRQLAIAQVLPLSSDGKTTAPDKPHDQPRPSVRCECVSKKARDVTLR